MNTILYAIGDIHGRDDLLEQLHEKITDFHSLTAPDQALKIIHLGDYIDGGKDGIAVIERLMEGLPGASIICLLGNHEAMMLECIRSDDRQIWNVWLRNGGDATLESLDISPRPGACDPDVLCNALGQERLSWLHSLPLYHFSDHYLFVHAGIVPGIPIEEQQKKDLLWIRGRFLDSDEDNGRRVIHGHTPDDAPVVRHNRICIDTGSNFNGILTAVVLNQDDKPIFLQATGKPGNG